MNEIKGIEEKQRGNGGEKKVEKKEMRTNEEREGKKACLRREMVVGTHSRKKLSKVTKVCLKS